MSLSLDSRWPRGQGFYLPAVVFDFKQIRL